MGRHPGDHRSMIPLDQLLGSQGTAKFSEFPMCTVVDRDKLWDDGGARVMFRLHWSLGIRVAHG